MNFAAGEGAELADYEPTNRLAVLALVIGAFAWLALLHPVLVFIPILAVLVAAIARRSGSQERIGQTMALVALVLGALFATWGPSRYFSRQYLIFRDARQHADQWLSVLQEGGLLEAHQLSMSMFQRQRPDVTLKKHYAPAGFGGLNNTYEPPYYQLRTFYTRQPLYRIMEFEDGFDFRFRNSLSIRTRSAEESDVRLLYEITPGNQADGPPLEVVVTMRRDLAVISNTAFWWLLNLDTPGKEKENPAVVPPRLLSEMFEDTGPH